MTSGSRPGPPIKKSPAGPPSGGGDGGGRPRSTKQFPETVEGAAALPEVATAADLDKHDGTQVRLRGTYVERDARMKATPPPVYVGHVAIKLSDGTSISFLPVWHDDALRPQAELDRLRDQPVEVVGTVFKRAPVDPRGGASPIGPAVLAVKALRQAP
jgi:hypothetical protein